MAESYEQQARDILERCGWEEAQRTTACDVVELANLLVEVERLRKQVAAVRHWVGAKCFAEVQHAADSAYEGYLNAQAAVLEFLPATK